MIVNDDGCCPVWREVTSEPGFSIKIQFPEIVASGHSQFEKMKFPVIGQDAKFLAVEPDIVRGRFMRNVF